MSLVIATQFALVWGWRIIRVEAKHREQSCAYNLSKYKKRAKKETPSRNSKREFMDICANHHKNARALAFAFILYDFEHPQIAKVLEDQHYWNALNKISGKYLTVFSFRLNSFGTFDDSRAFIKEQFGVDLPEENPSILFFQVSDKRISDSFMVEIKADMIEPAFNEVKEVLLAMIQSVENVQPEFRDNTTEVFNLITGRLSQRKNFMRVKKVLSIAQTVREAF